MAAELETRKRRRGTNKGRAKAGWPDGKAPAAVLREAVNDLSIAYATCVTVQMALLAQNADEDSELEICLRRHVAAAISLQIEELRLLAKTLNPAEETV